MTMNKQTMTLAHLISQRKWPLLESILTTPLSIRESVPIDDMSLPHSITPDIIIHFAVRFQAPTMILVLLSEVYPISLTSADTTGRYPIHVAAKWSATPDVIAFLITTNPDVAGVQDTTGKTPLHYVGECYLQHFSSHTYSRNDSMLQVVRLLKEAAPLSVNLEDNDGMNAVEYALLSDAHLKVVKTMQRACRDDWRERSKAALVVEEDEDQQDCPAVVQPVQEPTSTHRRGSMIRIPKPPAVMSTRRRRHDELVEEMLNVQSRLQREFSFKGGNKKSSNERVHVHRSSMKPNTTAARTA